MKNRIFSLMTLLIIGNSLQAVQWKSSLSQYTSQISNTSWLAMPAENFKQLSFQEKIMVGAAATAAVFVGYGMYKIIRKLTEEREEPENLSWAPKFPAALSNAQATSPKSAFKVPIPMTSQGNVSQVVEKKPHKEEKPQPTIEQRVRDAFEHKNLEAIKILLEEGLDINSSVVRDYTLFECACSKGMVDWLEYFLSIGADPNRLSGSQKNPPLVIVMSHNIGLSKKRKIVELLLKAGADVNKESPFNKNNALLAAAYSGEQEIFEFLLKQGANLVSTNGLTTLMMAAYAGRKDMVTFLLEKKLADMNAQDDKGFTALIFAVRQLQRDIVELLLKAGADVSLKTVHKKTALVMIGHGSECFPDKNDIVSSSIEKAIRKDILELLLKAGADANERDNDEGGTLLHTAVVMDEKDIVELLLREGANPNLPYCGIPPICSAIVSNNKELISLLLKAGSDPNFMVEGYGNTQSFLWEAVFNNRDIEIIRMLIDASADVNAISDKGVSVLESGLAIGNCEVIELLLKSGANPNKQDVTYGYTLLMLAIIYNHLDIVKMLLQYGADPKIIAKDGKTALDFAYEKGYLDIAELIQSHCNKTDSAS